ncbi:MAG: ABC transporter permease [Ruminococcus sp.]|jgi:putative ABC transport system permease protein
MKAEMKHYLDLVPISSSVRRKQSRMTRICIFLAVFLISTIFGMADMWIQSQIYQSIKNDGAWHVMFRKVDEKQMELIGARPEVKESARYAAMNYGLNEGYQIEGKETVICGFDENFLDMMPSAEIKEGRFPQNTQEAAVTKSLKTQLGVQIGDTISLTTPEESLTFTVTGFTGDTSMLTSQDAFGIFVNAETYQRYFSSDTLKEDFVLYVQFSPYCLIQKAIDSICEQLNINPEDAGQNAKLLGLTFQSSDSYLVQLYLVAAVLAVLVAMAGIFMISGSLNSNIAHRVQFFGLLRCLGATKGQVVRYVRREALNWCSRAIPLGMGISVVTVWGLCALLRTVSPEYFEAMPRLGFSGIGLAAGMIIGLLTVLLAARSPARKASRVSPLTAVSGNDGTVTAVKKAAKTRIFSIEAALGMHHAKGSRRNFFLMTCSFAFCIILFLSFSPAIDFMKHALKPLQPYTADLSVVSRDNTCSIEKNMADMLADQSAVKRVYGRSFAYRIPVQTASGNFSYIDLISYEENQFRWAEDTLIEGSMEEVIKGKGLLGTFDSSGQVKTGEEITLQTPQGAQKITVTGLISDPPFAASENAQIMICSEELFEKVTGEKGYTVIDMQLTAEASEEAVQEIREMAGKNTVFTDDRISNRQIRGAYYSFALFFYGFLVIIALISVFNIINSIAMSVTARMRQYGAMRAIGMETGQMVRMIVWETITYILSGSIIGCALGVLIHYRLYEIIITSRWGDDWQFPGKALAIILAVMFISAAAAVGNPARKIRDMSVAETIKSL